MTASRREPGNPTPRSRAELVESLRHQLEKLEGARRPLDEVPLSTGCEAVDCLLPQQGLARGTLAEWLSPNQGSGAATLALLAAKDACRNGGVLVVMDRLRRFYPPAAASWGLTLKNIVVVQARDEQEELWAADQALRCSAVAAMWMKCDRLDWREFRRLQLAAESGGSIGLLVRPARVRQEPTWADVRFLIEPQASPILPRDGPSGRRLRLEILKCRGASGGQQVELEIDDATGTVRLARQAAVRLAREAAARQAITQQVPATIAEQTDGKHETHPLPPIARMAPSTAPRRSARA